MDISNFENSCNCKESKEFEEKIKNIIKKEILENLKIDVKTSDQYPIYKPKKAITLSWDDETIFESSEDF